MTEVLEEAYEMVEHGWITDRDFRDFVFTNPVDVLHPHEPVVLRPAPWSRPTSTQFLAAVLTGGPSCSTCCCVVARSSTAPARPGVAPTSASATVASCSVGDLGHGRRRRDARHRRRRPRGRARLRRHPHALRRAAPVGPAGEPVAAARRHDRDRRQLRVHHRAARSRRRRRLHDADDGARRGHAARRAAGGPAVDWHTFGEWLDRLDGQLGVNAGFLVGHSTMRRVVMGDAAVGGAATPEQIDAMVRARARRDECRRARACRRRSARRTPTATATPCRRAPSSHDELLALARAVRDHEGTTLEFIAAMGEIPPDRIELMTDMSLAANRPLNWNLLGSLSPTEVYEQQLTSCDRATEQGAQVVALDAARPACACAAQPRPRGAARLARGRRAARRRAAAGGRRPRGAPAAARRRRRGREPPRLGAMPDVGPARDRRGAARRQPRRSSADHRARSPPSAAPTRSTC